MKETTGLKTTTVTHVEIFIKSILIFLALSGRAFGQNQIVHNIISNYEDFNLRFPIDRIYVQTDRPNYSNKDTIWLKAYILNQQLGYTTKSGLFYVELINNNKQVITRECIPIKWGVGFAQIPLEANRFPEGNYQLRAYTNWMRNIGEESFFKKEIYIQNVNKKMWLIHMENVTSETNGKNMLQTNLSFKDLNDNAVRLQDLNYHLFLGNKDIAEGAFTTDLNGKAKLNFILPDKYEQKLTLLIIPKFQKQEIGNIRIPLYASTGDIDLQFLPEGGHMVAGLQATIGFKAIDEYGKGINVSGNITNATGEIVAHFRSMHFGIGSFELLPQINQTYTAHITTIRGNTKSYRLPKVENSGIQMNIRNSENNDSICLRLFASQDIVNKGNTYPIIATANGKVCYAANLNFKDRAIYGKINKNKFPTGIVHFTLFNDKKSPLLERCIFIDHQDNLRIHIAKDKSFYNPGDSVRLNIHVSDVNNRATQANLSLAVTDISQIREDSTSGNIITYMLLSSGVKGKIEYPEYYFNKSNLDRIEALDNLLLSQGWISYDWKNIFNKDYQPVFKPQAADMVSGYITRTGGKMTGGLPISIQSIKKVIFVKDTITDALGNFTFAHLPIIDTPTYTIVLKDAKQRMFEASINVNQFSPPALPSNGPEMIIPRYVNNDATFIRNSQNIIRSQSISDSLKYPKGSHVLKEVVIKAIPTIKGSHFFAGAGSKPDQVMTASDMKKAGKMTLQEILEKNVKGFYTTPFPCTGMPSQLEFVIFCQSVQLSIDGFHVNDHYIYHDGFTDHWNYIKTYLDQITAEDIKGIEIKNSYIEVTTWNGDGAFAKRESGRYVYTPYPITWPVNYYVPKYRTVADSEYFDLRPTLLWIPNIFTDAKGDATITFKAKSKVGSYRVMVESADLTSAVGFSRSEITVK